MNWKWVYVCECDLIFTTCSSCHQHYMIIFHILIFFLVHTENFQHFSTPSTSLYCRHARWHKFLSHHMCVQKQLFALDIWQWWFDWYKFQLYFYSSIYHHISRFGKLLLFFLFFSLIIYTTRTTLTTLIYNLNIFFINH